MSFKPHKKLEAWKCSMELCKTIYQVCKKLPVDEKYGLVNQMKRAAVSIPSNIAEGAARNSKKEFNQFLSIALGSLSELDTQVELCVNYLNLLKDDDISEINEKLEQIGKMISGLKRSLKTTNH
jgi:four helix bundle protein